MAIVNPGHSGSEGGPDECPTPPHKSINRDRMGKKG